MAVFPIFYGGNISYYRALNQAESVLFEVREHFPKQTYRNRIEILSPNGLQKLVIPMLKTGNQRRMDDVSISYAENWQKDHWKSLEAAYRRSPYFEFYEDRFRPFYHQEIESLLSFNLQMHAVITSSLSLDIPHTLTTSYEAEVSTDMRSMAFRENVPETAYLQVFSDRHAFLPNLSMLDALFNLGPQAADLLR
ncbi:MAG: WbqC family protein [Flavobacteriales bacterium]|nr:WbqC family protein [Flavobacteriales bacterium]